MKKLWFPVRKTFIFAALIGVSAISPGHAAPPKIVSISPAPGTTDVDPATTAIVVKFDQDMSGGMSWTGGGPHYPKIREKDEHIGWKDSRTCVLPVVLEPKKVYRLGLNSVSYKNFKSASGIPLEPQTLAFATRGASAEEIAQMSAPKVIRFSPENGAEAVDPATTELSVTFDQPMGEGMSWTGGGENFPEIKEKPVWDKDHRTCTVKVELQPNHSYQLGINSVNFQNFQNKLGMPAKPVEYHFQTGAAK